MPADIRQNCQQSMGRKQQRGILLPPAVCALRLQQETSDDLYQAHLKVLLVLLACTLKVL